jgi:ribosome modulation factor
MEALSRDARRLVPRTLATLMAEREKEIFEEARTFPPELSQALGADLTSGQLQPQTVAALEARAADAIRLFKEHRVGEGVVRLGALLRIPADLSDPVLSAGVEGYPPGVTREYYAFIETNLEKIPVVLDNKAALKLERRKLPDYWQGLLGRSRVDSPVIRTELFQRGRVVDHRTLDYRSPVFGVGSLSYSRAVTAIAATWLAVWREARGDVTRMPRPTDVKPSDAPPSPPSTVRNAP